MQLGGLPHTPYPWSQRKTKGKPKSQGKVEPPARWQQVENSLHYRGCRAERPRVHPGLAPTRALGSAPEKQAAGTELAGAEDVGVDAAGGGGRAAGVGYPKVLYARAAAELCPGG